MRRKDSRQVGVLFAAIFLVAGLAHIFFSNFNTGDQSAEWVTVTELGDNSIAVSDSDSDSEKVPFYKAFEEKTGINALVVVGLMFVVIGGALLLFLHAKSGAFSRHGGGAF